MSHLEHWFSPTATWPYRSAGRLRQRCNEDVSVSGQRGRRPAACCARVLWRKPSYILVASTASVSWRCVSTADLVYNCLLNLTPMYRNSKFLEWIRLFIKYNLYWIWQPRRLDYNRHQNISLNSFSYVTFSRNNYLYTTCYLLSVTWTLLTDSVMLKHLNSQARTEKLRKSFIPYCLANFQ